MAPPCHKHFLQILLILTSALADTMIHLGADLWEDIENIFPNLELLKMYNNLLL